MRRRRFTALLVSTIDRLSYGGFVLTGGLVLLICALVLLDIVTRWIGFNAKFVTNSVLLAMVWLSYAGCAHAHKIGAHVGVDTVVQLLPAQPRAILEVITEVLCLCVTAVVLWSSWQQVILSFTYGATLLGAFRAPLWLAQAAVTVGMLLLLLQSAIKLRRRWTLAAEARCGSEEGH